MTDRVVKTVKRPERKYKRKYALEYYDYYCGRWRILDLYRSRVFVEVDLWATYRKYSGYEYRIVMKGNDD